MPSYYVPDLSEHSWQIRIDGDEFHHLIRVARQRTGDGLILNSGQGILARARITEIESRSATVELIDHQSIARIRPSFAIAFPLLQNKHDEWIVEKATELGCISFYPYVSQRTVRKPSANTHARFEKIALTAIKQCDNPYLPSIAGITNIQKTLSAVHSDGFFPVILSERRPDNWLDDLVEEGANLCLIIGPEGGFVEEEYDLFQGLEIPLVSVSPLILRAETAALAAAAQFNLLRRIKQTDARPPERNNLPRE